VRSIWAEAGGGGGRGKKGKTVEMRKWRKAG